MVSWGLKCENKSFAGLYNEWYDGCYGWLATPERLQTFAVGEPYLKIAKNYFFLKKGSDASSFDSTDISGKKIGTVTFYTFYFLNWVISRELQE